VNAGKITATCLLGLFTFAAEAAEVIANLPLDIPEITDFGQPVALMLNDGVKHETTIRADLQAQLTKFIRDRGLPVAAVVLADVKTGDILAMAQGRLPEEWGGTTHTALHAHFPAASLFKTVVASAAFELAGLDAERPLGLTGGCGDVRPTGVWMRDQIDGRRQQMTLRKAYGHSCNGYFAKLAINYLGLNALKTYAYRFGWDGNVGSDFKLEQSPMTAPEADSASVHSVGRFAAGFGYVGISAMHATWITMAIANDGLAKPLRLFKKPVSETKDAALNLFAKSGIRRLINPDTAAEIRGIMDATIRDGTSSFAFRRGKHRQLRFITGGKTGTLTGYSPKGVTTWFTGMMPLDRPEVVVTAVVVLDDLWHIKGPNLAAEALLMYREAQNSQANLSAKAPQENL